VWKRSSNRNSGLPQSGGLSGDALPTGEIIESSLPTRQPQPQHTHALSQTSKEPARDRPCKEQPFPMLRSSKWLEQVLDATALLVLEAVCLKPLEVPPLELVTLSNRGAL